MSMSGDTILTRDLVERLPICLRWRFCDWVRRVLYWLYLVRTSESMLFASCKALVVNGSKVDVWYLLQQVHELCYWLVCSVFHLVPAEGLEVLL